jgi:hypothetical protein
VQSGGDVWQRIERHAGRSRNGCGVLLSTMIRGSGALMAPPNIHRNSDGSTLCFWLRRHCYLSLRLHPP